MGTYRHLDPPTPGRSRIMSAIRSKGNETTEIRFMVLMRQAGIKGWRRNSRQIGKPDFVFPAVKVAVFVDGCFWHGCPRCGFVATANRTFWANKIRKNRSRDRRVGRLLRKSGWTVIRFWEHELRVPSPRRLALLSDAQGDSQKWNDKMRGTA